MIDENCKFYKVSLVLCFRFVRFYDECMPLLARVTLHKASSDSVRRLRLVRITTLRFYVELLDSACVQPWKTVLNEKGSEKNQQSSDLAETKRTRNVALDSLRSSETDTVPKRPENSADRLASLASKFTFRSFLYNRRTYYMELFASLPFCTRYWKRIIMFLKIKFSKIFSRSNPIFVSFTEAKFTNLLLQGSMLNKFTNVCRSTRKHAALNGIER